ncbi:MAG: selenide, water dikinase SelD [Bacteroidales bacterium]
MCIEKINLLQFTATGGCSAKIPPQQLADLLKDIQLPQEVRIMVNAQTHDDAGVYKLNADTALIVTTDFFPPVCEDPFEFGEIAAANSLSDIYAMGGDPLLCLNLNMYPSQSLPLEGLREILLGGQSKINEAGAFTMGGHTIEDTIPKYGLAVVGSVHPEQLITNANAQVGDLLILTKPLGIGVLMAAHKMGLGEETSYKMALQQMKLLNKAGKDAMQKLGVRCATDITGFGLLGHLMRMMQASGTTACIHAEKLPVLPEVLSLIQTGCIPGAAFRNLDFVKKHLWVEDSLPLEYKMLCVDAQTSGGLLMCVAPQKAEALLRDLQATGLHAQAAIIGEITPLCKDVSTPILRLQK